MPLKVELVSVERLIWSGEADMVIARTTEGELGVLPGHAPVLGQLSDDQCVVQIHRTGESNLVAAVHGGFLSVTSQGVSILAEIAELSEEIDVDRARRALERAQGSEGDEEKAAVARANARIVAASKATT